MDRSVCTTTTEKPAELPEGTDGLAFTTKALAIEFGGGTELATPSDGRVRLYVCTGGNVESYLSGDRGTTTDAM